MKIIVGLGNPGREYEATRHNIGFMVIDKLAAAWDIELSKTQHKALLGEGKFHSEKVILMKPMTYMNLSGEAVGAIMRWHKLKPEDVLVVYDDMDLVPGKLRIRTQGSAGGHNGIKSIIQHLGTEVFTRLKLGIGRPQPGRDSSNYVLQGFSAGEKEIIQEVLHRATEAIELVLTEGAVMASNKFNIK